MPEELVDQTAVIYRELAAESVLERAEGLPSFRPDSWDLRVDGILVELDEERHFNRYREQTLRAPAYERLASFPATAYRTFCVRHESQCLASASYGGFWSNKSCETMFGEPGELKDLSGAGAPRWKQRAFYDHLKDLAPLCGIGPMVRLAVWDELPDSGGMTIGDVLNRKVLQESVAVSVMRLVHERANPS